MSKTLEEATWKELVGEIQRRTRSSIIAVQAIEVIDGQPDVSINMACAPDEEMMLIALASIVFQYVSDTAREKMATPPDERE